MVLTLIEVGTLKKRTSSLISNFWRTMNPNNPWIHTNWLQTLSSRFSTRSVPSSSTFPWPICLKRLRANRNDATSKTMPSKHSRTCLPITRRNACSRVWVAWTRNRSWSCWLYLITSMEFRVSWKMTCFRTQFTMDLTHCVGTEQLRGCALTQQVRQASQLLLSCQEWMGRFYEDSKWVIKWWSTQNCSQLWFIQNKLEACQHVHFRRTNVGPTKLCWRLRSLWNKVYLQKRPVFSHPVFDRSLLMDWMIVPILRREKMGHSPALIEESLRVLYEMEQDSEALKKRDRWRSSDAIYLKNKMRWWIQRRFSKDLCSSFGNDVPSLEKGTNRLDVK